jgi:hypothetical protein
LLKIEILKNRSDPPYKMFPRLMKNRLNRFYIILFDSPNSGTVLNSPTVHIGTYFREYLDLEFWEDFDGTLTLSNDQ